MKPRNKITAFAIALMISFTFVASMATAQDAAAPSLNEQLEAQYTTSTVFTNGSVQTPGVVLVLQQNGAMGVPLTEAAIPTAQWRDGMLHKPSAGSKLGASMLSGMAHGLTHPNSESSGYDARPLPVGDKIYVSNLNVNLKKDRITFTIAECASCNGTDPSTVYKAAVAFDFTKGSLASMSVPDVEDTIAKVFTIDTSAAAAPQPAPQPEQPSVVQSAPAPAQPVSIQLGQTIDQVVAVLGQPEKTAYLGSKQIYVYKDLKVTFVDGKVSSVE